MIVPLAARWVAAVCGIFVLLTAWSSVIGTLIVPRPVGSWLTRGVDRVVVATYDFSHRSLVDDEATAYHEGIPGHHMQRSVAQQMRGLPKFRQHGQISGYGEGWALYAEQVGKEVGFYQDPVSDYGRLSSELFRAVRLVVDTGIHSKGWTRDQVVGFFRKSASVRRYAASAPVAVGARRSAY